MSAPAANALSLPVSTIDLTWASPSNCLSACCDHGKHCGATATKRVVARMGGSVVVSHTHTHTPSDQPSRRGGTYHQLVHETTAKRVERLGPVEGNDRNALLHKLGGLDELERSHGFVRLEQRSAAPASMRGSPASASPVLLIRL